VRRQRGPDAVRREVTDEGRGAGRVVHDPGEGVAGSGLHALHERLRQLGGQLEIRTDTHGTTVTAVAPLMVEGHAAHPAR
jgi:signal transduction histidine kinase